MFYEFFRWLALITGWPFDLIFFTRKVYYEDKKMQSSRIRGGALIISNHYHFYDYMATMFTVAPRKLNVVAAEMPFRTKIGRFGMKFFGGIEANRETRSMRFVDTSAELIRRDQLVLIYPEGRITTDGRLGKFKPSYIAIAHRASAPIIPIVLDGQYSLFKRTHMIIGKPIYLSDYFTSDRRTPLREDIDAANDAIYRKVSELRNRLDELKAKEKGRKR